MEYDVKVYAVWGFSGDAPELAGAKRSDDHNAAQLAQEIAEAARAERARENPLRDLTDPNAHGAAYYVEDVEAFETAVSEAGLNAQVIV